MSQQLINIKINNIFINNYFILNISVMYACHLTNL